MPDYKQGKIYTIRSPNTDKYYIGSTTQPLHKRFYEHKRTYENGTNLTTASFVFDYIGAYIELLEEFSCNNRNELDKREGELQREHKDKIINKIIAGRTDAEYRNDNKEKRAKYDEINKEEIKIQKAKFYTDNKEKLIAYQIQYNENNKEKIKIRKAQYYAKKKLENQNINL
jgi:hypothetical protein